MTDTSRRRVLVAITAVGEQHSDISVNSKHPPHYRNDNDWKCQFKKPVMLYFHQEGKTFNIRFVSTKIQCTDY